MSEDCGWGKALVPPHVLRLWLGLGLGTTTCLRTVVGGKTLVPPHVLKLWLGVRSRYHHMS